MGSRRSSAAVTLMLLSTTLVITSLLFPEVEAKPVAIDISQARKYTPIFNFDDASAGYCFPDDKRNVAKTDGTCADFRDDAPVFFSTRQCGRYTVYQYNLWYGKQMGCFWFGRRGFIDNPEDAFGGKHHNDNEHVQVWVDPNGDVAKVRYDQHNGHYFKYASRKGGAEFEGSRAVVYIGKVSHGAYHTGCNADNWLMGVMMGSIDFCLGGCGYWDDFRNTKQGKFRLREPTLIQDPSPHSIDCNPGLCREGHDSARGLASSSCFGVHA